jgi:hypothetical protein
MAAVLRGAPATGAQSKKKNMRIVTPLKLQTLVAVNVWLAAGVTTRNMITVDLCSAALLEAPDLVFNSTFYWIWLPQEVQEIFILCWCIIWLYYCSTVSRIWLCVNFFHRSGIDTVLLIRDECNTHVTLRYHMCSVWCPHIVFQLCQHSVQDALISCLMCVCLLFFIYWHF